MDIAEVSMNISQNNLMNALGATMLSKSLDMGQATADLITESIDMNSPSLESLVYPTSGTAIDLRV